MLHLFDSARTTIESVSSTLEEKSIQSSEANSVFEERVMAIEQDHRCLNKLVLWRTAIDCELANFHKNLHCENWFIN